MAWAALVLTATSIPNIHLPGPEGTDKVGHFSMYCMLAFLSYRAIVAAAPWRTFALIALLISAFGALDEWHQQFIPGRSMDFNDWIADTSGGVTGVALAMFARSMSARGARKAAA